MSTKERASKKLKKSIFLILILLVLVSGVFAQTKYDFPAGDFWSFDAGVGMGNFLVKGNPFQVVLDPKLWLSPAVYVGTRVGLNYSKEKDEHDIFTIEGQVYLRWNFLHLGKDVQKTVDFFIQGGLGMIAAYRGWDTPFDEVTRTRGSVLADAAFGVTIPLTPRWHIEPSVRGGYPHIWGVSLTTGYKFPLPKVTYQMTPTRVELVGGSRRPDSNISYIGDLPKPGESVSQGKIGTVGAFETPPPGLEYVEVTGTQPPHIEYVEVIKILPPNEIIKRIIVPAIEFIIFGPDIGSFNVGIDRDAQQLNELVLNSIAKMLNDDRNLRVRIEGHANPFTISKSEQDELLALSSMRANVVANQLRAKGVSEEQLAIISLGGTRNATSDWDVRNRNRRVELMIIQFIPD